MTDTASIIDHPARATSLSPTRRAPQLSVVALGMGLGSFFALTFVLCVLFDLWFPDLAMNTVWAPLLPGFNWISWPSFGLGLIETFSYGWYVAVLFVPLYNYFSSKFGQADPEGPVA